MLRQDRWRARRHEGQPATLAAAATPSESWWVWTGLCAPPELTSPPGSWAREEAREKNQTRLPRGRFHPTPQGAQAMSWSA